MRQFHIITASFFGTGYIEKGAGSVAAAACCLLLYFFPGSIINPVSAFSLTLILVLLGIWSSGVTENFWGKDSKRIVIDEVAGMFITMLNLPISPLTLLAGFILFRFFDIAKPLGIRSAEKLGGGLGVMADDVVAGIYSNIVLQALCAFKLFST
ncbi:MAG: phosphatidylglycerophosphatase A [Bacteroidota bacterium]